MSTRSIITKVKLAVHAKLSNKDKLHPWCLSDHIVHFMATGAVDRVSLCQVICEMISAQVLKN